MVVTIVRSFTVEVQDHYDGGKRIIRDFYKSDIPEDMTVEDFAFKVFFNVKQASKKRTESSSCYKCRKQRQIYKRRHQ